MKNILDYRLLILDKNANIIGYPKNLLMMHQDCLDDFAEKLGYVNSNRDYLVNDGNCLFYNADNGIVIAFLPSMLNSDQLYKLDYIENYLNDIEYMEVSKGIGNDRLEYSFDIAIRENFSNQIIQSYYNIKKK